MEKTVNVGLQKAIDAAGSRTALAEKLGITLGAISQWDQVPIQRVPQIEKVIGVSRYELRPDFFGAAEPKQRKRAAA